MSLFVMLVIAWLVLGRMRACAHGPSTFGSGRSNGLHRRGPYAKLPGGLPVLSEHRPVRARSAPSMSRYDILKRRYVSGELTDEQYEHELDLLLRQPGGMKEF